MNTVASLFVFIIGALGRFAFDSPMGGFNTHSLGDVAMLIGAIGFFGSLAMAGMSRDTRMAPEQTTHPAQDEFHKTHPNNY